MDKVVDKLKRTRVSTTILGIVSITWLIVDYFVVMNLYNENAIPFGIDLFLLAISAVSLLSFHIITFLLVYHTYRLTRKLKQNAKEKNEAKSEEPEITEENENRSDLRNQ